MANLVLDRTKYVGTGHTGMKRAQIRHEMRDRADRGEYHDIWIAHETDIPLRNAFPGGRMGIGEDALDEL